MPSLEKPDTEGKYRVKLPLSEANKARESFLKEISPLLPKESVGIEIGAQSGVFSSLILKCLPLKKLYLIDPWEKASGWPPNEEPPSLPPSLKHGNLSSHKKLFDNAAYSTNNELRLVQGKFSQEINEGRVELKQGLSYDLVDDFPNNYFDFIYIDACHIYECVKADLEAYLPKLKPAGLMCGHDYYKSHIWGVDEAVDEFLKTHKEFKWQTLSPECDWALRRK